MNFYYFLCVLCVFTIASYVIVEIFYFIVDCTETDKTKKLSFGEETVGHIGGFIGALIATFLYLF